MKVTYDVRTGVLMRVDLDTSVRLGVGYSGTGPAINNPDYEAVRGVGPVPRGTYRLHRAFDNARLGPCCLWLEPRSEKSMFGRSGFFIHGDNALRDRSASHGCIILDRSVRQKLAALAPCELEVL